MHEGETAQLDNIYISSQKELQSKLIVTKLTAENKVKRELIHKKNIQKHRGTLSKQRSDWNSVNVYMTNFP